LKRPPIISFDPAIAENIRQKEGYSALETNL